MEKLAKLAGSVRASRKPLTHEIIKVALDETTNVGKYTKTKKNFQPATKT